MAPRGKSYSRASEPGGLAAFRVIPIQTKYPRALSSCIMHTHRQQKQPPPFTAGLDSPRPGGERGFAAFPFPPPRFFSIPSISCYFIVLRLNSSFPPAPPAALSVVRNAFLSLSLFLSRVHTRDSHLARCSSLSFSSGAEEDIPKRMMAHTSCTYAREDHTLDDGIAEESRDGAGQGCMQIHRVLSIKYSAQGDHVLSPTPSTPYVYLLLPGISR